jgi:hypothetical protein
MNKSNKILTRNYNSIIVNRLANIHNYNVRHAGSFGVIYNIRCVRVNVAFVNS